ncbi:MAG: diacylglycerol kinase family lipid kinase [Deltaproteobacteria bacterium]|nr:diacylglycerol kinase family lipid kinase [Deltaproteobacteria bacterium]
MSKNLKTFFIINPKAGGGKADRRWPRIRETLRTGGFDGFEEVFTEATGHATELATEALRNNFEMVVAVGGDGTIHEVVNGFFHQGTLIKTGACLGILSLGRGSDLIRALGRSQKWEEQLRLLYGKETRMIDLGKIAYLAPDGRRRERYFVNIADCGIVGDVLQRLGQFPGFLGGTIAYLGSSLESFLLYRNKKVTITIDGEKLEPRRACAVIVANGQSFGGGLKVAPKAEIDDGLLDILIVADFHLLDFVLALPRLYAGTIDRSRSSKIIYRKAKKVHVASEEKVLLDVDGEQPGLLPAAFEIVPKGLAVKA